METRLATLQDAGSLSRLHASCFTEALWDEEQFRQSLKLASTQAWIGSEATQILGFLVAQIVAEQREILTFVSIPITDDALSAKTLLEILVADAKRTSATEIFLEVASDNTAALALYRKNDFRQTGMRKKYYQRDDKPVDALMLVKTLYR